MRYDHYGATSLWYSVSAVQFQLPVRVAVHLWDWLITNHHTVFTVSQLSPVSFKGCQSYSSLPGLWLKNLAALSFTLTLLSAQLARVQAMTLLITSP